MIGRWRWRDFACRDSSSCTLLTTSSEALHEDESFPERGLAALVASKVYYHLQEYNESMVLALGAGKLFKLDNGGEYEETIIGESGSWAVYILLHH